MEFFNKRFISNELCHREQELIWIDLLTVFKRKGVC